MRHTVTGPQMRGNYLYPRRDLTAYEQQQAGNCFADEYEIFMDNIPLNPHAQSKLGRDTVVYENSVHVRNLDDTRLPSELVSCLSSESKSAIILHKDYAHHVNWPRHDRSLPYYLFLNSIHCIGDVTVNSHNNILISIQTSSFLDKIIIILQR